MFPKVEQAIELLRSAVAELDPASLDGGAVRRLLERFAEAERLAGAGRTLAAHRLDETGSFDRSRFRSAAHFIADVSGTTVAAAEATISTAQHMCSLPVAEAALRAGDLSGVQAKEIAAAGAADPSAAPDLVRRAQTDGVKGLKADCARVIAAATRDADAGYERIRRERSFRHWRDPDGRGRIDVRGPLDATTRVAIALESYESELFEAARNEDRHERPDALMFDALIAMADVSTGPSTAPVKGPRSTLVVRVDYRAFLSGDTEPGERCEIAGVGPIPVSVARRLSDDAIIKALVTDGVDVLAVSHLGRTIPAHLRTALEELYPECAVEGCNTTFNLEIDHNIDWSEKGPTALWNLSRLCPWHHDVKTRQHLRLEGAGTSKRLVAAAGWRPPDRPPSDRRRAVRRTLVAV